MSSTHEEHKAQNGMEKENPCYLHQEPSHVPRTDCGPAGRTAAPLSSAHPGHGKLYFSSVFTKARRSPPHGVLLNRSTSTS